MTQLCEECQAPGPDLQRVTVTRFGEGFKFGFRSLEWMCRPCRDRIPFHATEANPHRDHPGA